MRQGAGDSVKGQPARFSYGNTPLSPGLGGRWRVARGGYRRSYAAVTQPDVRRERERGGGNLREAKLKKQANLRGALNKTWEIHRRVKTSTAAHASAHCSHCEILRKQVCSRHRRPPQRDDRRRGYTVSTTAAACFFFVPWPSTQHRRSSSASAYFR